MKILYNVTFLVCVFLGWHLNGEEPAKQKSNSDSYPYWPPYQYLEIDQLEQVKRQNWKSEDHVIGGWDWSLPDFVEPADRSMLGLQRNFHLDSPFVGLDLKFKANAIGVLWVKWRDLEPEPGVFRFQPLIDRIRQANDLGIEVLLRILCHSKSRGSGEDLKEGDAPLWLEELGATLLPQQWYRGNLNFDPAHPEFHRRYKLLIQNLGTSGIPGMVSAAYVGYASRTYGDEGIGPYGERNGQSNDTVQHVRERLDAWAKAFEGMEHKVFMGGFSEYGIEKGFGVRRGFVEMYYYNIPNAELGQYIDEEGYLTIDEEAPVLKNYCFNGEENEEYEAIWATDKRENRFGKSTESFSYRYFMSSLRALQMRCTYLLTKGHLIPEMLPFISLELARTVKDTPDVWALLNTAFIKDNVYNQHAQGIPHRREIVEEEGIEIRNFERWLYQRDAPGFETLPAMKINQPIEMWMIQPDKYYDFIARSGKKIGFDIDNRWAGSRQVCALKVTYFDIHKGKLKIKYNQGREVRVLSLKGDSQLRTATFIINNLQQDSMTHGFDFTLEAGKHTEKLVVSIVRVINTNPI